MDFLSPMVKRKLTRRVKIPGDIKEEWVKNTQPSVLEQTAHMAPIGFTFLDNGDGVSMLAWLMEPKQTCWI